MGRRAKILTVSDGVAAGSRVDRSGPALAEALRDAGFEVLEQRTSPDGDEPVAAALRAMTAGFTGVVVTTGGTGFGPRDRTPEATRAVLEREAPGMAEAIRRASDTGGRPYGMLSRGVCGTVGAALVVNTPGSEAGALEALDAVLPAVPHALELLAGGHPH